MALERYSKILGKDKEIAANRLLNERRENPELQILEKIKFQWKTCRKAFHDMNVEKTGQITRNEFKFYLHFWGLDISDEQFEHCFNKFDLDKDGVIGYKDF